MRGRPDVELRVPSVVHPGDEVPIEILVEARSETPIDFVDLTWAGEESVSVVVDGKQRSSALPLIDKTIRLLEAGTLAPVLQRLKATIQVPRDAPASYMGVRTTIHYELRLHVSIPWWPDLHETVDVIVTPRPTKRPAPAPATKASPRGGQAFVELSIADTSFAAGDEITGAFAIGDLPRREGLGVEVSLVGIEVTNFEGSVLRAEQLRHNLPFAFPAERKGAEVPFRFRVPKEVVPSFASTWCELTWRVQATLRLGWGEATSCAIPVTIARHAAPGGASKERPRSGASKERPKIGASRWRTLWRDVGEARGLVLASDRLALTGSAGDVRIEIERDESDEVPMLVATLRYPSLELGLRVKKKLVIVLPNALESRLDGIGVESRSLDQAGALLTGPVCEALTRFKDARMDDARAVVRAASGGLDAASLEDVVGRTIHFAEALREALAAVPPPAGMETMLPAWRSFAESTGAHLSVGGMALFSASVDGAVFDVATVFGDKAAPAGTRVTLDLDPPLEFRVNLRDPESFSAAPPGARDLATALAASVRELEIDPHAIRVLLPGPAPDPADLRPKMEEMLMLARRLRGERTPGPYR